MPRKNLPEALRRRRTQLGRSLRAAADVSGLSNARLCQLENASEAAFLSLAWVTLQRVCKAYDVPFSELNKQLENIARRKKAL